MIPEKGHGAIELHPNKDGSLQLRDKLSRFWCACGGAAIEYFGHAIPPYQFKCSKCTEKLLKLWEYENEG